MGMKIWFVVLVITAVALVGCGHAPTYVGRWEFPLPDSLKRETALPNQIEAAKSFLTINADCTWTTETATGRQGGSGTYTVDGDKLTMSAPLHTAKFNPSDQTLTLDNGAGGRLVLRKG
jgi:hypothetical protein